MIASRFEVMPGFRKANINNIPTVRNETVVGFITKLAKQNGDESFTADAALKANNDLRVDFVQVKKSGELYEASGMIFAVAAEETPIRVAIKLDVQKDDIFGAACHQCVGKDSCPHILAFVFWLHRKSTDTKLQALSDFWGSELEAVAEEKPADVLRVRDVVASDKLRLESDVEAAAVSEAQGQAFVNAILNGMEALDLVDMAMYKHFRPVYEEFEPIFIHHTMLDASNNGVKDMRSLMQHMEDHARQGLFDRFAVVSKGAYKTQLWLEAQYMRVRCSLIHRIVFRQGTHEDEEILESLFCKDRENNAEERKQLKQHKRFILKEIEKVENKEYRECGVLLDESYPYICATPDGITDDHIVEIKAPKSEEEFEKFMQGHETIAPKYMSQIQIQMYMASVTKALYCVVDPNFNTNSSLTFVWVQADINFVATLLRAAEDFWKSVVFPRLAKIYLGSK